LSTTPGQHVYKATQQGAVVAAVWHEVHVQTLANDRGVPTVG
jgi:hypothetical protein